MGSITTRRGEVYSTLSEITGYKAGLSLLREEILAHLPDYHGILQGNDDIWVRIDSVTFENMVTSLLHQVGYLPKPQRGFPGITGLHKYKHNPEAKLLWEDVMQTYTGLLESASK